MSVEALEEIIESKEEETQRIREFLNQRYIQEGLIYSFASLNDILDFVQTAPAGEMISERMRWLLLATFQTQVIHLFEIVDESGMSALFEMKEVYAVLKEFSYSESKIFQADEKRLLWSVRRLAESKTRRGIREPSLSEEEWDAFWRYADRGKVRILDRIASGEPFSFESFLSSISDLTPDSFDLIPFSPLNWKRFAMACAGGLLGVGNLTAGVPTLGTAFASLAPAFGAILVALSGEIK